MTFARLQSELGRLLSLEGWNETTPGPAHGDLINEALQLWSWEAEYVTAAITFSTIAGTAEYDLTATPISQTTDWKIFKDVYYGNLEIKRSSEDEVRVIDPQWYVATSGTPERYFLVRPNVLRFYPAPNAVQTVTLYGIRADTDLSATTSSPKCPSHYHRNIPRLAAWMYGESFAQGEAMLRLEGYYKKAMDAAKDCQLWAASQNQRGLQRTVERRGVARVYSNGEDQTIVRSV